MLRSYWSGVRPDAGDHLGCSCLLSNQHHRHNQLQHRHRHNLILDVDSEDLLLLQLCSPPGDTKGAKSGSNHTYRCCRHREDRSAAADTSESRRRHLASLRDSGTSHPRSRRVHCSLPAGSGAHERTGWWRHGEHSATCHLVHCPEMNKKGQEKAAGMISSHVKNG